MTDEQNLSSNDENKKVPIPILLVEVTLNEEKRIIEVFPRDKADVLAYRFA